MFLDLDSLADLNPLDYSIWAEINRRMRRQELAWKPSRRETRGQYLQRLRRTAMNLPRRYVRRVVGHMATRVGLLRAARGGHFPEGGR